MVGFFFFAVFSTLLKGMKHCRGSGLLIACSVIFTQLDWSYHLVSLEPASTQHMVLFFDPFWPVWISNCTPAGRGSSACVEFPCLGLHSIMPLCWGGGGRRRGARDFSLSPLSSWMCWGLDCRGNVWPAGYAAVSKQRVVSGWINPKHH